MKLIQQISLERRTYMAATLHELLSLPNIRETVLTHYLSHSLIHQITRNQQSISKTSQNFVVPLDLSRQGNQQKNAPLNTSPESQMKLVTIHRLDYFTRSGMKISLTSLRFKKSAMIRALLIDSEIRSLKSLCSSPYHVHLNYI